MLTDMDIDPFIALAEARHREADLLEQELEAIAKVLQHLQPYLESGYALEKWKSALPRKRAQRLDLPHLQGTCYLPPSAWQLFVRSDGALYYLVCRPQGKRFRKRVFLPWTPTVPNLPPDVVLGILLEWRTSIHSRVTELQGTMGLRANRVAQVTDA